ncbi:hypothetical protein XarbCFBP8147_12040 [Xanthomonas arboricola]|nr:hypothetical protein XarbCFBP8147_12040 [Xanthomonas arboricola]
MWVRRQWARESRGEVSLLPSGEGVPKGRMRGRAKPHLEQQVGFARTLTPTPAPRPGLRQRRRRTKARAPVARKLCRGALAGEA